MRVTIDSRPGLYIHVCVCVCTRFLKETKIEILQDILMGNNGNDDLQGGTSADELFGGKGALAE